MDQTQFSHKQTNFINNSNSAKFTKLSNIKNNQLTSPNLHILLSSQNKILAPLRNLNEERRNRQRSLSKSPRPLLDSQSSFTRPPFSFCSPVNNSSHTPSTADTGDCPNYSCSLTIIQDHNSLVYCGEGPCSESYSKLKEVEDQWNTIKKNLTNRSRSTSSHVSIEPLNGSPVNLTARVPIDKYRLLRRSDSFNGGLKDSFRFQKARNSETLLDGSWDGTNSSLNLRKSYMKTKTNSGILGEDISESRESVKLNPNSFIEGTSKTVDSVKPDNKFIQFHNFHPSKIQNKYTYELDTIQEHRPVSHSNQNPSSKNHQKVFLPKRKEINKNNLQPISTTGCMLHTPNCNTNTKNSQQQPNISNDKNNRKKPMPYNPSQRRSPSPNTTSSRKNNNSKKILNTNMEAGDIEVKRTRKINLRENKVLNSEKQTLSNTYEGKIQIPQSKTHRIRDTSPSAPKAGKLISRNRPSHRNSITSGENIPQASFPFKPSQSSSIIQTKPITFPPNKSQNQDIKITEQDKKKLTTPKEKSSLKREFNISTKNIQDPMNQIEKIPSSSKGLKNIHLQTSKYEETPFSSKISSLNNSDIIKMKKTVPGFSIASSKKSSIPTSPNFLRSPKEENSSTRKKDYQYFIKNLMDISAKLNRNWNYIDNQRNACGSSLTYQNAYKKFINKSTTSTKNTLKDPNFPKSVINTRFDSRSTSLKKVFSKPPTLPSSPQKIQKNILSPSKVTHENSFISKTPTSKKGLESENVVDSILSWRSKSEEKTQSRNSRNQSANKNESKGRGKLIDTQKSNELKTFFSKIIITDSVLHRNSSGLFNRSSSFLKKKMSLQSHNSKSTAHLHSQIKDEKENSNKYDSTTQHGKSIERKNNKKTKDKTLDKIKKEKIMEGMKLFKKISLLNRNNYQKALNRIHKTQAYRYELVHDKFYQKPKQPHQGKNVQKKLKLQNQIISPEITTMKLSSEPTLKQKNQASNRLFSPITNFRLNTLKNPERADENDIKSKAFLEYQIEDHDREISEFNKREEELKQLIEKFEIKIQQSKNNHRPGKETDLMSIPNENGERIVIKMKKSSQSKHNF